MSAARIERALAMTYASPAADVITTQFLSWAASREEGLSDPLKSERSFHAAWSAWRAGKAAGVEDERCRWIAKDL